MKYTEINNKKVNHFNINNFNQNINFIKIRLSKTNFVKIDNININDTSISINDILNIDKNDFQAHIDPILITYVQKADIKNKKYKL